MGLYKNVAGQKIAVFAYDTAADAPKTGDAANISAQISLDFGTAAPTDDAAPTELDATDHPGIYVFDLTQAETNADNVLLSAVSATSDVVLDPVQVFTVPPNFRALGIESDGDLTKVNTLDGHTAQTGDSYARIGAAGAGLTEAGGDGDHLTKVQIAGTLTTLDTLPAAIEAAILDEGDATALLAAIAAKVEEFLVNEGDATATIAAIATACNSAIVAGTVGSNVTAIKAKTDNLPASPAAVGSEMTLANDAITAAKFDESTAFPLASADSGSTELARTGADADTLETISDEIAALNDTALAEITGASDIPATPTIRQAIALLYAAVRNNNASTSDERRIANDAGTVVLEADMADDGTTFTQGKLGAPD